MTKSIGLICDRIGWEEKSIIREIKKRGIELCLVNLKKDTIFRLDNFGWSNGLNCDVFLQRSVSYYKCLYSTIIFEKLGYKVVNSGLTAEISGNKLYSSLILSKNGLLTPKTYVTFSMDSALRLIKKIKKPVVLKPLIGSWGRLISFVNDYETAYAILRDRENSNNSLYKIYYIQEYISKTRDIRAFVVGEEVVAAMYRYNLPGDWRSNATRGAKTEPCKITPEIEEVSLKAAKAVNGEILGIDLIESENGFYVVEVNHNPQFKVLSKTSGVNIYEKIVDYLCKTYSK